MIALVRKEINQLKEREENNGSGHTSVNNYRNPFSIFYKYYLNDWINKSTILVRNYTYNSFGNNFYKPYEKKIMVYIKNHKPNGWVLLIIICWLLLIVAIITLKWFIHFLKSFLLG